MKTTVKFLALLAIIFSVALFTGCDDPEPYAPPQAPPEEPVQPMPNPMDDAPQAPDDW